VRPLRTVTQSTLRRHWFIGAAVVSVSAITLLAGCGDNGQARLDAASEEKASAQASLAEARSALESAETDRRDAERQLEDLQADLDGYNLRVDRGGATYRERTAAAGVEPNLAPKSLSASAQAERACMHYRNIVGDIVDGELDAAEIGTKFSEVARDAKDADEQELRAASSTAKETAQTFNSETMFTAIVELHDACSLVGK